MIRSVSGTHKVGGKDEPYISNKVGLNRYTWDFNVNGPVKWNGAKGDFRKGPDTGPGVVPGAYSVRMTLSGHTYVQHFNVEPDPRSRFTQADYQRSFDEAMRQMAHLSQVDTMLNNLDDLKKAIDAAMAPAKKAEQRRLDRQAARTRRTRDRRSSIRWHVNVRGEGTEDETKLHEDVLGAFQKRTGSHHAAGRGLSVARRRRVSRRHRALQCLRDRRATGDQRGAAASRHEERCRPSNPLSRT